MMSIHSLHTCHTPAEPPECTVLSRNQVAFLLFMILGGAILLSAHMLSAFLLWMCVGTIPMACTHTAYET